MTQPLLHYPELEPLDDETPFHHRNREVNALGEARAAALESFHNLSEKECSAATMKLNQEHREIRRQIEERFTAAEAQYSQTESISPKQTAEPNAAPSSQPRTAPTRGGGPKTEAGKATSSLNNLRHGLTGSFRVLEHESQADFDSLLSSYRTEHAPATASENDMVERMAEAMWLSRRAQRLQDEALINDDLQRLSLYLRYQTTVDRNFHRCLAELRRLRQDRLRQFESQNQQQEQDKKDQLRQSRVRLANAKAEHLEVDSEIRRSLDIPSQEGIGLPFMQAKELFTRCLVDTAAKLTRKSAA